MVYRDLCRVVCRKGLGSAPARADRSPPRSTPEPNQRWLCRQVRSGTSRQDRLGQYLALLFQNLDYIDTAFRVPAAANEADSAREQMREKFAELLAFQDDTVMREFQRDEGPAVAAQDGVAERKEGEGDGLVGFEGHETAAAVGVQFVRRSGLLGHG